MQKVQKILVLMLMLFSMTTSTFAAEVPEPHEIIRGSTGKLETIEKVYVLSASEDGSNIPTADFTENGMEYSFVELKQQDNAQEDVKEHSELISIHTSSGNTQTVIAKFEPELELSTEDGYTGTLACDYATLIVTPAGYGKQSYTITENRSYPNLMDADTSLVPKTLDKDGATLNLTNITWQSAATDNIDGHELAIRYTANATYSGTGTKTYTKGYTATAEYKGEIRKVTNDTVTFTAIFREVPSSLAWCWWVAIIVGGILILGAATVLVCRLIGRRDKG